MATTLNSCMKEMYNNYKYTYKPLVSNLHLVVCDNLTYVHVDEIIFLFADVSTFCL